VREVSKHVVFLTKCPVVFENQMKYNRHTNKFHNLKEDKIHEEAIGVAQLAEAAAGP
jgi:uncharacterized C2H2 Zn-finger protein